MIMKMYFLNYIKEPTSCVKKVSTANFITACATDPANMSDKPAA